MSGDLVVDCKVTNRGDGISLVVRLVDFGPVLGARTVVLVCAVKLGLSVLN